MHSAMRRSIQGMPDHAGSSIRGMPGRAGAPVHGSFR